MAEVQNSSTQELRETKSGKSNVQNGVPAANQNFSAQQLGETNSEISNGDQENEVPVAVSTLCSSMQYFRVTLSEKKDVQYQPVMKRLVDWLLQNNLMDALQKSVEMALSYEIDDMIVLGILDSQSLLTYANKMLSWTPEESFDGKDVYYHIVIFYFVLNQPPLAKYQNEIKPWSIRGQMNWLTGWLVDYAGEVGKFCDDPGSITPTSLDTFRKTPSYKLSNYIEPRGGWQTFNQFFAREIKPGYRTIYGLSDPTIIVSPADCTFCGSWDISSKSVVTLRHLQWNISDLLRSSGYASLFSGGVFTHSFLNTFDYHRLHTPVEGKVLESCVIEGQVCLETRVITKHERGPKALVAARSVDAPDSPGYQFVQTSGVVVIDSPIGLVAVVPIGMATVPSVIMTVEERVSVRKGEEIGYFQFGGSDILMFFQAKSKVALTAVEGIHLSMGMPVGTAKVQP